MDRASKAGSPLMRTLTVALTNGASLRLPSILRRERPHFASMDIYNHNLWRHKIVTEASLEAEQNFLPDFSKFYKQFRQEVSDPAGTITATASKGATAATAVAAPPSKAGPVGAAMRRR